MVYMVLMVIAAAVPVFATGIGETPEPPGDIFTVGLGSAPTTLDPHAPGAGSDADVLVNIYEGLVAFDDRSLTVAPSLARSWEVSGDGLTYTFYLREGVTFHDGTPLDAAAVKFNFDRIIASEHFLYGVGPFPLPFSRSTLRETRVLDEYTVQLSLAARFPQFLAQLASPAGLLVSPTAVVRYGEEFGENPVGTGPFRFVERENQPGGESEVTIAAYEDYWGPAAGIGRIRFRSISDEDTRTAELLAGTIDLIEDVPADAIQVFRQRESFTVDQQPLPYLEFLVLNMREGPFTDRDLRLAATHALDREALVARTGHAADTVADSPISPVFERVYNENLEPYPYDPRRARELVARTAYHGEEIVVYVTDRQWGAQIETDLTAVGFNVAVQRFDQDDLLERVRAGLPRNVDIVQMGWQTISPETLPVLALATEAFPELGGFNLGYYSNPHVDDLLSEAAEHSDEEERNDLYRTMQAVVHSDVPWVFVANRTHNIVAAEVESVQAHPSGLLRLETAREE